MLYHTNRQTDIIGTHLGLISINTTYKNLNLIDMFKILTFRIFVQFNFDIFQSLIFYL